MSPRVCISRVGRRAFGATLALLVLQAVAAEIPKSRVLEKVACSSGAVLLRPERSQIHFELARVRAQLGDKKRAVAALQQAVAAGFDDPGRIETEKAFDRLRGDPAFQAIGGGISKP